ncbi:MAG: fibrobacter succinogenes major paralogous domain-containing protein [Ignavibacteria bacterium]|jgi:uncharacterized protein (TIGR02145 family)|nr:fibrobacter succinogenes major paralogous domain-containing protein [Ignavibacteria bacterium]
MKHYRVYLIIITAIIFAFGSGAAFSQVTDVDGKTYQTVTIGKQVWMSENLNVERYRNGDPIPQVQDKEEWNKLTTGAWCWYDNDEGNGSSYGKLYNWYAVSDSRGLAPEGWHIPTDEEWTILTDKLGGALTCGTQMKASSGWDENFSGDNKSGFSALPCGYRTHDGYFSNKGRNALFWTATEFNSERVWFRNIIGSIPDVYRPNYDKNFGLSVRCVKD